MDIRIHVDGESGPSPFATSVRRAAASERIELPISDD